jgi:hypothetical protein
MMDYYNPAAPTSMAGRFWEGYYNLPGAYAWTQQTGTSTSTYRYVVDRGVSRDFWSQFNELTRQQFFGTGYTLSGRGWEFTMPGAGGGPYGAGAYGPGGGYGIGPIPEYIQTGVDRSQIRDVMWGEGGAFVNTGGSTYTWIEDYYGGGRRGGPGGGGGPRPVDTPRYLAYPRPYGAPWVVTVVGGKGGGAKYWNPNLGTYQSTPTTGVSYGKGGTSTYQARPGPDYYWDSASKSWKKSTGGGTSYTSTAGGGGFGWGDFWGAMRNMWAEEATWRQQQQAAYEQESAMRSGHYAWLPELHTQAQQALQDAIYDEVMWWTPRDFGDAMSEVMFKRLSERAS